MPSIAAVVSANIYEQSCSERSESTERVRVSGVAVGVVGPPLEKRDRAHHIVVCAAAGTVA